MKIIQANNLKIKSLKEEIQANKHLLKNEETKFKSLNKQYNALTKQRNELAIRQGSGDNNKQHVKELTNEVERLTNELKEKNLALLRAKTSKQTSSSLSTSANSELIKRFEKRITSLEEEKSSLSLARADELKKRMNIEKKLQQQADKNQELKDMITSLRLKLERVNIKLPLAEVSTNANHVIKRRSSNLGKSKPKFDLSNEYNGKREKENLDTPITKILSPNKNNLNVSVVGLDLNAALEDDKDEAPPECKQQ